MRPIALALALLAAPIALTPARAESPAQRAAKQQVERDQRQDRVADAARDLQTGGSVTAPPLVGDMDRQGTNLAHRETDQPVRNNPRAPAQTVIPLLSDNPQR
ncbi:hypothetical protein [Roseomonas chloroacetimidivorans]|jgi:hypothetical protein|uniref:hypothetical protein n=1 Tax=Roseomonas chloroacetimidivorans TaxID=1766656 RepID=UPI003C7754B7